MPRTRSVRDVIANLAARQEAVHNTQQYRRGVQAALDVLAKYLDACEEARIAPPGPSSARDRIYNDRIRGVAAAMDRVKELLDA